MNVNRIGSIKLRFRRRTHPLGEENKGGDYGKVPTGAWIWQERLLSRRTVFYTPSALKFECHCHSIWERFGEGVTGHSWSAQLDNISHLSWMSLVEEYMSRDISRPSDRLPAIESVMKRIGKSQEWSPFWGVWANALVESLGWELKNEEPVGKHECRMNPGYYVPTWSWVSAEGPISYLPAKPRRGFEETDPLIYDLEVQRLDSASGRITVAGYVLRAELNCRVELDEVQESNLTMEKKFNYHYGILDFYKNGAPHTISPDVPLKPLAGYMDDGRYLSVVVRVPYGETPPEKSWNASCRFLLVGKRKLTSLVLILGGSLREIGAWERVGWMNGLPPTAFEMARRDAINIF